MTSFLGTPEEKNTTGMAPATTESKRTVLIYSPDLNFCFSLSMLFQDRYNVVTTTNPGMLETFADHYAADLVIVDAIPSEKMIERLDGLKKQNRKVPVIMLYVYSPKEAALDATIRSHVDSVIYKPFDIADMARRVAELLPR
jgi:DNA-binding NtrC family response regulator